MNAHELLQMLLSHYNAPNRPPGWLLAAEIQAPRSGRRADLIAAPLTQAGGSGIIGHEIKVTRSDVLAELADPTKHDDWAKYCDRWYLVIADPGLVADLEIPEHWGIMAPPSGRRTRSMTILRKAPSLSPVDTSDAWMRLARWKTFKATDAIWQANADANRARRSAESAQAELQRVQVDRETAVSPHVRKALELIRVVEQRKHEESLWQAMDCDLIADAVVDVLATREAAAATRRMLERVEADLSGGFTQLANRIKKAKKLGAHETGEAAA